MENKNIIEKADEVIERILNEIEWDYLSQPARIKLLQTLLPYRLPKLKDSEITKQNMSDKVEVKILGHRDEVLDELLEN